jgi:thiol-disulfide isomerase/thioredoxin
MSSPRSLALASLLALISPIVAHADPVHVKGAEPLQISHGDTVKLEDYLVTGKITVIDFYSKYCPPCMALAPLMEKLHQNRSDLAVVEVDINRPGVTGIDWKSPVAGEFKLESIPSIVIYGANGSVIADGDKAREMVVDWVQK